MEPALKQRVVGAAVLVALAVIFLPMLIKGPAPESGVSDVPLKLPDAPQGDGTLQTRELPLVAPGAAPASGVVGLDASDARTEETAEPASNATTDESSGTAMMPAATAGGDYAVSFGRYASAADAGKVVAALRASQLPGYQESTTDAGRTLYRVRIGPYATQADAEAARLRAAHVRDDVGAKVVVLDADAALPTQSGPTAASQPVAAASAPVSKPEPLATESKPPAPKPATTTTAKPATPPATTRPAATATAAAPTPAQPAASGTGFAEQQGAFASATEATKLRDRARAAGMRAFVDSVRTDKGVLSRVRVGPVLTRAEADQLKAQVAAKLGIGDAIVKPHP